MKLKWFSRDRREEPPKEKPAEKREQAPEPPEPPEKKLPLPNFFPGMRMEVLTLSNRLIFMGLIDAVEGGGIQLSEESGGKLPYIEYNDTVKLRGFVNSKIVTLEGMVGGSNEDIWKIDRLRTLQIEERRQFFRQNTSLPGKVMCVNGIFSQKQGGRKEPTPAFDCRVVDLSAGGTMFQCKESFEPGDYLFLSGVEVQDKEKPFSFTCQVRRRKENRSVYEYGCEFCDMDETEHERLIRAILILQRKELRARRGQSREE